MSYDDIKPQFNPLHLFLFLCFIVVFLLLIGMALESMGLW